MMNLKEVVVTLPEFEALRLIDVMEKSQGEAAKQMQISQPTFSRILDSARKKISKAIINGNSIKIEK